MVDARRPDDAAAGAGVPRGRASDLQAVDPHAVDPRAVRAGFSRAAARYDRAAALQREVGSRMLQRLDVVRIDPRAILDAGCGTGESLGELAARYPRAHLVGIDCAIPMVEAARRRGDAGASLLRRLLRPIAGPPGRGAPDVACADMLALPFAAQSIDLVWSNLALQWVNDLPAAFDEFRRVLRVGGLLSFTTLGPDTLYEVREAFAGLGHGTHTSRFIDMHDIGDMLLRGGFADPVMDMEKLTLTYATPQAMLGELRTIGAANRTLGRPRGLTGRKTWAAMIARLEARARDGRIPATFEVVYGHAWKAEPRRTAEGRAIVRLTRPDAPR
jgi:malonyl-CoA O-methyltransferase